MASTQDQQTSLGPMNCMEVWGGSSASETQLHRPGLDIWVRSRNVKLAREGGGDLHLLSSCASGRITRMLLADICGIGPIYAEIATELRELMKRNVNTIQQTRVVRDISQRLDKAALKGGFASILVSTFFAPTRSFSLCNTGHPHPLVYRQKQGAWSILKADATPTDSASSSDEVVGFEEYKQIKTKVEAGDIVLSYSNGLTECSGADGLTLGNTGILEIVKQLDASNPASLGSKLVDIVATAHEDNSQAEEATVLLCRGTTSKVAMRDNLLAPFRLLGGVSDNTAID